MASSHSTSGTWANTGGSGDPKGQAREKSSELHKSRVPLGMGLNCLRTCGFVLEVLTFGRAAFLDP